MFTIAVDGTKIRCLIEKSYKAENQPVLIQKDEFKMQKEMEKN
jgi:hypothetical protein